METTAAFGTRLRAVREAKHMTVTELADASGVGRAHIHAIESGVKGAPKWETVCALADGLGVSVEEFR